MIVSQKWFLSRNKKKKEKRKEERENEKENEKEEECARFFSR